MFDEKRGNVERKGEVQSNRCSFLFGTNLDIK